MLHQKPPALAPREPACRSAVLLRRSAAGRRGTARSPCRISRPHRRDRRRRRCLRRARPSPPPRTARSRRSASPSGTAPAALLLPACRRPSRRSRARSCVPRCPAATSSVQLRSAASRRVPSILPTATQMSRPTVSASSIGPIGMPNASAASSTVSGAMPSSTQRIAAIRYGASTRLTRKPGALFTGSGSLSIWRTNAAAARDELRSRVAGRRRSRPASSSRTGLKKWRPISRDGSRHAPSRCPRAECDDVLVARIASGFALASRRAAKSARLASTFSKIASMIDVGARDAVARDVGNQPVASHRATRRGSRRRSAKSFAGALHRRREPLGILVLQRDREAAQRAPRGDVAAHRAGADDVHVRRLEAAFLAERLQPLLQPEHADQVGGGRRLRAATGSTPDRTAGTASALPSYFAQILEDRVRRRIVLAPRALRDLLSRLRGDERAAPADSA